MHHWSCKCINLFKTIFWFFWNAKCDYRSMDQEHVQDFSTHRPISCQRTQGAVANWRLSSNSRCCFWNTEGCHRHGILQGSTWVIFFCRISPQLKLISKSQLGLFQTKWTYMNSPNYSSWMSNNITSDGVAGARCCRCQESQTLRRLHPSLNPVATVASSCVNWVKSLISLNF